MRKPRILIVEDETVTGIYIREVLEEKGFSVIDILPSAEEALLRVGEETPDIVLLDIQLSGEIDGVEAALWIGKHYAIPCIYITVFSDEENFKRAQATNPYGYVLKPINEYQLYSTIEIALEKYRNEQSTLESEIRFRTLFNNMVQGVLFLNADGAIESANPSAQHILGLSLDQLTGRSPNDPRWHAVHGDGSDFPGETHPVMEALRTGKCVSNVVMGVFNPRDDGYRWININAIPLLRQGADTPYQVDATFEDITARKRIEEELKGKNRYLGSLNDLLLALAKTAGTAEVKKMMCEFFRSVTGAVMTAFQEYRKKDRELWTNCFSADPLVLEAVNALYPDGTAAMRFPVDESRYRHMMATPAERVEQGLFELLMGKISPDDAKRIEESLGIGGVYAFALRHEERLIGAMSVLMPRSGGELPRELLETYSQIASTTLQRRYAEEKLAASEELLKKAQQVAHLGNWMWDVQENTLEWSDELYNIFGVDKDTFELNFESIENLIHPEDRTLNSGMVGKMLAGDGAGMYAMRIIRSDGEERWINQRFEAERGADGGPLRIFGTIQDITEIKRADEARLKTEERFRRIIETGSDIIFEISFEGYITYCSPSVDRLYGVKPENMIGRHFTELLPPREQAKALGAFGRLLSGETIRLLELEVVDADAGVFTLQVSVVPRMEGNMVTGLQGSARDITGIKALEKEIVDISQEERARMGHDLHDGLGQLLTGISIMLGALEKKVRRGKPLEPEELGKIARKVEESIEKTRVVARGLSPLILWDGGLKIALEDLVYSTERVAGIRCRLEITGGMPELEKTVETNLYFIVQEAFHNALRHSGARNISLVINNTERRLIVRVHNDGKPRGENKNVAGIGMKLMRHRAGVIGATLETGLSVNGYAVTVTLSR